MLKESLKKEKEEEIQCDFRAIKMPAHIKENRLETMEKEKEAKREERMIENKKKLEETFDPFNFVKREEAKKLVRSESSPDLRIKERVKNFEATPYPEHIFTNFASEQIR